MVVLPRRVITGGGSGGSLRRLRGFLWRVVFLPTGAQVVFTFSIRPELRALTRLKALLGCRQTIWSTVDRARLGYPSAALNEVENRRENRLRAKPKESTT